MFFFVVVRNFSNCIKNPKVKLCSLCIATLTLSNPFYSQSGLEFSGMGCCTDVSIFQI